MGCLSSVSFFVLINGKPSRFFKASISLRQGFPLSPILFVLIVEGLIRAILHAKETGHFKGIGIKGLLRLTHLLFKDDVLIFYDGSHQDGVKFIKILLLFW